VTDSPIRLLLVGDEARIRQGLFMCLSGEPDFEVVGEATSGEETSELTRSLQPDVVILDVCTHGLRSIEAARELKASEPLTRVVMLSLHDDAQMRAAALGAGATAIVGKQEGITRLFETIRSVARRARAS